MIGPPCALPIWRFDQIVGWTLVDSDTFAWARHHRLRFAGNGYACFGPGAKMRYLHREILGLERGDGRHTDHANRDPLDNRRENLRECSAAENHQNRSPIGHGTSSYRGVSWHTKYGKWRATIGQKHIGYFDTEQAATLAVREARAATMPFSYADAA